MTVNIAKRGKKYAVVENGESLCICADITLANRLRHRLNQGEDAMTALEHLRMALAPIMPEASQ